mgnify:CR=1 FL=1
MSRSKRKPMAEINVVPYIDVMLVLLVVFMITAPMLTQGISVELPKAASDPINVKPEDEPLIVSIKKGGTYHLDIGKDQEKSLSLDMVKQQVGKIMLAKPATQVLVNGDRNVSYGVVVELMTVLQSSGVPNVGLITDVP